MKCTLILLKKISIIDRSDNELDILGLKDFSIKIQNFKSDILISNKPVLVSKRGESIKRGNIVSF